MHVTPETLQRSQDETKFVARSEISPRAPDPSDLLSPWRSWCHLEDTIELYRQEQETPTASFGRGMDFLKKLSHKANGNF